MFPANGDLGRLGNSIAWWLGIQPYELFLYVFLPPLLLDAAVRIDFFLFKRVCPSPHKEGGFHSIVSPAFRAFDSITAVVFFKALV